jgi:hypothetical protein
MTDSITRHISRAREAGRAPAGEGSRAYGTPISDPATLEACRYVRSYHAELGPAAPKKFSPEEQHAITILAAYIRDGKPS